MNWLRVIALTFLCLLLVPIVVLVYYGLGPLRTGIGYGPEVFRAVALSLVASATAAVVDVVAFTPLAYYLGRNRNRGTESLVDIPVSVPHPIIGVALLVISSPITPVGRFLISVGINLFDTVLGLVIALVIVSAPIYVKSLQPYFESRDQAPEQFAMGLGASPLRTYASVVLPDSSRSIISGALLAMSRALSEFGSIAILAYYVLQSPFYGVSPAAVLIYQYYSYYGLGAAVTTSVTLIAISVPLALAVRFVRRE
ncbi:MAG TPA: ABC transporter permease [Nitrososphaerales archaeon]|nr:ABC transporter permease [Nitrososphaerales archaeon]